MKCFFLICPSAPNDAKAHGFLLSAELMGSSNNLSTGSQDLLSAAGKRADGGHGTMGQDGHGIHFLQSPQECCQRGTMAHSRARDSSALCADPICEAGAPREEVADSSQCEGEGEGDEENPGQTPLHGSRGTAAPGHRISEHSRAWARRGSGAACWAFHQPEMGIFLRCLSLLCKIPVSNC